MVGRRSTVDHRLSASLKRLMVQNYLGKWAIVGGLIGLVAGVGVTLFFYGIYYATSILFGGLTGFVPPGPTGEPAPVNLNLHPDFLLIPLSTALGAGIAGAVIYMFAPEAEGHGTDEAVAAFHRRDGRIRRRVPLVKAVASIFTIGSGGSGGREGPAAQIGAGFGSFVADALGLSVKDRRTCVAVGLGAGIGAIFKAPFAGAILSGELLYSAGDFEVEALVPAFIAAPAGYLIFASITGFTPIFGNSLATYSFITPSAIPVYLALGLACGIVGRFFSTTFYTVKGWFQSSRLPRYTRPVMGAIVTGLIGIMFPQVLGLGYGFLQYLVNGDLSAITPNYVVLPVFVTLLLLVFLKVIATSFTVGSGGSAGVFAPSLVIGGFMGALFWLGARAAFPGLIPTAAPLVIVGMMALFAGVGRAPIAVMLMVSEMTGSLALLVPAVFAVLVAYFVVTPRFSIYKSQVPRRTDSPAHLGEYSTPLLRRMRVTDALVSDVVSLPSTSTIFEAETAILDQHLDAVPVLDPSGAVVGIFTASDLAAVPVDSRKSTALKDVMTRNVIAVRPDDTLLEAMQLLVENDIDQLPVVETGTHRLIGMITMKDAMRAYGRAVEGSTSASTV